MPFPLPRDTAAELARGLRDCRNLGLWLDKYQPINDERDSDGQAWSDPSEQWKLVDRAKRRDGFGNCLQDPVPKLLAANQARREAQLKSLKATGRTVVQFDAHPDYRMVVGFGAEHVLETNLCLHRLYGFPIIPGSAIKGVARARAFWTIAEALQIPPVSPDERQRRLEASPPQPTPLQSLERLLAEGDEVKQPGLLEKLQSDSLAADVAEIQTLDLPKFRSLAGGFQRTFGTTSRRGEIVFFDAYPLSANRLRLELDVLNPHFGKYYRGESPPADYLDPVPTYFLTVGKDVAFGFALASRDDALAQTGERWLKEGLTDLGIGGKTCAGYGFMQVKS